MDKDFQGGSKESSSENNNNISLTPDQPCKPLSTEAPSERKENETITSKNSLIKSDPAHRHGVRVTASHSTIEHLGDKTGDLKRSGSTGQARSKSFWDQLPAASKGPPSMRVSFNGKKGTHGSHGDGLSIPAHGKGLLLNDSLEKGEEQQKKQHILHPNTGLNSAPVAQRVFDSSLSFADLVRACGQRRKPSRLECGQLNNSLLSTPQSSTLVSNYFNKYRSYLDHLRKTHGYPKPDSDPAGVRPPTATLALPLPCITPVFFEDNIQDPDYVQILEKTTTDSIRSLWSYQLEGGEAERILLQCSNLDRRVPAADRQGRSHRRSLTCDHNTACESSIDRRTGLDVLTEASGSHTTLNTNDCAADRDLNSDFSSDLHSKYNADLGLQSRHASDFDLSTTSSSEPNQNTMKNNMASLLPQQQYSGTAEWGDSQNDRKTPCVGYSLKTRNMSSIDTMAQKQRMLQQKQQQEQQQHQQQHLQQQPQPETTQADMSVSQPPQPPPPPPPPPPQSLQNTNSVGSKLLHGTSNSRHKICSRFQGMSQMASSSAVTSVSLPVSSEQSRMSQPNTAAVTPGEHSGHVTNVESVAGVPSQSLCNGIYPMDSHLVSADPAVIPSMSGTMTYSRTLKASYACLDPSSSMPLSTKDGFRENVFGDVDDLSLPDSFQQIPEAIGESKWMDFQNRQQAPLGNEKTGFGENPTKGHGRSRMAMGFPESEPPQHWSASLKSGGSQRPINKMATKDTAVESYLSFCNHKEKNSSSGLMSLGSASNDPPPVGQKHSWGSSYPNNPNRLDVPCDVSNDVTPAQSNDLSRLHQWRLHTPAFESSKTNDSFQNSLDPFGSSGNAFGTKSSWSTCGDVSPNKNVLKFLHQRAHNSNTSHLSDGVGGQIQHSYQASRLTDHRHKLFNNNNAASLAANDKGRLQIENGAFMPSEPWLSGGVIWTSDMYAKVLFDTPAYDLPSELAVRSSATCDDMTEYFDSTLQFPKTGMSSSQSNASGMTMDSLSSRCLSQNSSSVNSNSQNSQSLLGNFSSPAFRCNDSYNPLQTDRPTSIYTGQKDVTMSSGPFSSASTLQDQQKKQQQATDEHSFLSHDNTGLGDCNSLDIGSNDTNTTLSPPWYEIAPIPEDMEEIRNDKNREQNRLGHLNFLDSASSERDNQFSPSTGSSEINYPHHHSYNVSINSSNQNQNTFGIPKIESKPRLILGANTINQRLPIDTDREPSLTDSDKNRILMNAAVAQDNDKLQHRKQFPFPCHPKLGCASSSQITASHFQQPQFQIAGVNHQQTTNGVPQQMYCIPNILMPPPQHQSQGRHPGVLSYPGMMGNVAPSSPFPQGLMRVPLVDMSRLVYLQSLPFNMASTNLTPNSNHNNSSSSNPHVNTSNIITINTMDNDFSATGDKGGGRPTKPAGIRGKSTLLRLRSSNTIGDSSFQGLRSAEDPSLLTKGNKLRSNNGNPWDADLEHDFSSSLFSKVTSLQDQSRLHQEFGLVYPETQTAQTNPVTQETNFRSSPGVQWPSTPDIHPEMLDMLPVRKQPIEDYSGRQVCWTDMELMMSSATKEQMQVVRKSNKPLGSNKANLISILPKISPGEMLDPRCKESGYE